MKDLEDCLGQRRHFSLFVVSVNGLFGVDAEVMMKHIGISLATKWNHPYYRTSGYITNRIAITLVRVIYHCIRSSQVTVSNIRLQHPQ